MTPQELRNSILQLAIQGRLVEQRPEEGTAEELYRQIQAEKQALIKAGKIKKEKPLPEIGEEEMPFDIPESWKWVRLGNIGTSNIGLTYKPKDVSTHGTIVLRSNNIKNSRICYDDIVYVSIPIPDNKKCEKGDILICARNGSKKLVGKAAIIDRDNMSFGAFMAIFRSNCNDFIIQVLQSCYFRNSILGDSGTTTINQITQEMLRKILVPLPPLAEQKRIVAKIEELLPLIDRYEKAYNRLNELNRRFPEDMQKSLLQLAIQGKLVEQRPEEGTAEELYRQIQAEKQALIKAGKIKKEKPLPEIKDEEIPFEIPENWKWVRIGDIFSVGTGLTPLTREKRYYDDGNIPWVTSSLTSSRYITTADTCISEYALEMTTLKLHPEHTLIIAMYGEGKTRGQISELLIPATTNQACATLDNIVYNQATVDYTYFFFTLNYEMLRNKAGGSTQPNLNLSKIKETMMPLPPLAEQKRIAAKLEELLPLCERLQ